MSGNQITDLHQRAGVRLLTRLYHEELSIRAKFRDDASEHSQAAILGKLRE
jgi:hypothetical protein